jgi:hypothetical protein
LLQATSICSALLNIIFRLNIFPTMNCRTGSISVTGRGGS